MLYSYTRRAGADSVRLTVEWSEELVELENRRGSRSLPIADFEAGTVRELLQFPPGETFGVFPLESHRYPLKPV
ncbi:MAG: hypothetical protein Ct9H300mP7_5290 [Verrucomicrobiota bacterium]|nr:MAG: hypothetical protein Ct9H300mP7_5290 [Verrucomicrobiota bacterium]